MSRPDGELPWAQGAQFCPVTDSVSVTAKALRCFYDAAPNLPCPPKPATWTEVAHRLLELYENVLRG